MAVENNAMAGYDEKGVWAQVFRRDKAAELLKTMLDEEAAIHRRLMELACGVKLPAVQHAIA